MSKLCYKTISRVVPSTAPFEVLDCHEALSLVYVIFLDPSIPWLSG